MVVEPTMEPKEQVTKAPTIDLAVESKAQATKEQVGLHVASPRSSNSHLAKQQATKDFIKRAKRAKGSAVVELARIMRSPKGFIIPVIEVTP